MYMFQSGGGAPSADCNDRGVFRSVSRWMNPDLRSGGAGLQDPEGWRCRDSCRAGTASLVCCHSLPGSCAPPASPARRPPRSPTWTPHIRQPVLGTVAARYQGRWRAGTVTWTVTMRHCGTKWDSHGDCAGAHHGQATPAGQPAQQSSTSWRCENATRGGRMHR